MPKHGCLGTDDRPRVAHSADRLLDDLGAEFPPVVEVGHDGEVSPGRDDALEEAQQLVGIVVVHEPVGPERQRLGADANVLHMCEFRRGEHRIHVACQVRGLHHHGVTAGEKKIGDVRVLSQMAVQAACLLGIDFHVLADELCPAEAERAVGVARLAAAREEENGLAVLVLDAFKGCVVRVPGDVEFPLAGRMGVEAVANRRDNRGDLFFGSTSTHEIRDPGEVALIEHPRLRERHLVDGVVRYARPVDQFIDHIAVGPEGEDAADDLDREPVIPRNARQLRNTLELPLRDGAVAWRGRGPDRILQAEGRGPR